VTQLGSDIKTAMLSFSWLARRPWLASVVPYVSQVRIVRERTTAKIMAMKKLKKAEMLRRGQVSRQHGR
jgi:hypothetical protein